jgi:hypothetical protein
MLEEVRWPNKTKNKVSVSDVNIMMTQNVRLAWGKTQ